MSKNILDPDYSLYSGADFFFYDVNRVIILLYSLFSLTLTVLIQVGIFLSKKKKISVSGIITNAILIVNLIHTISYTFEWIIKNNGNSSVKITNTSNEKEKLTVGGLLVGNLNKFNGCYIQSFLLISSSISKDNLINLYFFLVSSLNKPSRRIFIYLVVFLGFFFPFLLTLVFLLLDALGLNDEFCYVKKFEYINDKESNLVSYKKYDYYAVYNSIVYAIHIINFFCTIYFVLKITWYIFRNAENKENIVNYLLSILALPIVQLFTILVGILYTIAEFFYSDIIRRRFFSAFLILNTIDSILIPLIIIMDTGIYRMFLFWRKSNRHAINIDKNGSLFYDDCDIGDIHVSTMDEDEEN